MADTPAIEITEADPSSDATAESGSGKTITYNPNIAIEPADPEITFEVDFTEAPLSEPITYAIDTSASEEPAPITPVVEEALPVLEALEPEPIRVSEGPRTIEELLADAETAELDRDFKSAIRKYWEAISKENNRADIWNLLSRAYLIDGQLKNAETAALESVRLNPREVAYTLDYLRVAQRSKEPESFLAELETAYDRFPASPEITLSLARAYERIAKDNYSARNLYLRFVDIAPNHPLVAEASAAAERLR
jgi:tetratricopeptide (TPR) repeat protein